MRILIADDSNVMRQIVKRTLRQAGYDADITEAGNGREALEAVKASTPDLVLSDWNMPEMTGIDLLNALRAAGNAVPFGFITSESSDEMRAKATSAGAKFLVTKPFTPDSFREALEPVLG
ncbi:MAG: response regulator [Nocardioidaceae bacterium]|nr:response regulator [Nocardioidaceae bacterium]